MNSINFAQWKKQYLQNHISKDVTDTILWLNLHHIDTIPQIIYNHPQWACHKGSSNILHLKRYKLVLNVQEFNSPYIKYVVSLLTPRDVIKQEFFNIFGNTCKIVYLDIRTIKRQPCPRLSISQITINTTVKPQYKEDKSSTIITNMCKNAKRSSWPSIHTSPHKYTHPKKMSLDELKRNYHWSTDNYHQKLVHYFTQNIEPVNHGQPRLVLMFGIPGSGKNWVLNKRQKKNHVIINIDDCLAMLPDYWRGIVELQDKDKYAFDWIQTFRAECKQIAQCLFKYALKHKMNIVWNGTGKNIEKYSIFIQKAKKRGYIIELNGIWVPLEIAKKRVKKRKDSYGRDVPDTIIKKSAHCVPLSFNKLRLDADYARIWENVPNLSPRIIWDKQQGWLHERIATDWIYPIKFGHTDINFDSQTKFSLPVA